MLWLENKKFYITIIKRYFTKSHLTKITICLHDFSYSMNYLHALTPLRFISRSSVLEKSLPKILKEKKNVINIKDKVNVPVETDTHKLANYVCGTNLMAEEGEDIKLKPDSEYPEWLWSIRSPPPLEELDKNSKTYWNRIRRFREREAKYLKSLQKNTTVHK